MVQWHDEGFLEAQRNTTAKTYKSDDLNSAPACLRKHAVNFYPSWRGADSMLPITLRPRIGKFKITVRRVSNQSWDMQGARDHIASEFKTKSPYHGQ